MGQHLVLCGVSMNDSCVGDEVGDDDGSDEGDGGDNGNDGGDGMIGMTLLLM